MSDIFDLDDAPSWEETRAERIARLTREGGLGAQKVPPSYDDPDMDGDDWKSIQSKNPFERLFLDVDQVGRITDAMVSSHGIKLARFWERKLREVSSGATSSRRILREMGDASTLGGYAQQVQDDAKALATPQQRTAAAEDWARILREQVETPLRARYYEYTRDDRTLSPDEAEQLLVLAEDRGATRSSGATFILHELADGEYLGVNKEVPDPDARDPERLLLSTSWSDIHKDERTPERVIGSTLSGMMINGHLSSAQARFLLDKAEEEGVDRESTAEFMAERMGLANRDWRPPPGEKVEGNQLADILVSCDWYSVEVYEEEQRKRRQAHRDTLAAAARDLAASGEATPSDLRTLLSKTSVDPDEAARLVRGVLEGAGLRPQGSPAGGNDAERLVSTPWVRAPIPKRDPQPKPEPVAPDPRPDPKPTPKWPWAVLLLGVLATAVYFFRPVPPPPPPMAFVETAGLNVRTEPTSQRGAATVIGEVRRSDALPVTGYVTDPDGDRWLRVRYRGETGWVSGELMRFDSYDDVDRLDYRDFVRGGTDTDVATDTGPDPSRLYTADELDQAPRLRGRPLERFSPDGGYLGEVVVRATLDANGRVEAAACRSNAPADACAEAEQAVRAERFEPGQVQGTAVRSQLDVAVAFEGPEVAVPPPPPPPDPDRPATVSPSLLRVESPPGGYEGTIRLRASVSAQGRFVRAQCPTSAPAAACRSAQQAAAGARYGAARVNGSPAEGTVAVSVRFTAPACSEATIAGLVRDQMLKGQQCATLTGEARERCLAELDTIKQELRDCSN